MIQPNAVNASGLNKATKAELIQIVLYCQSMEHVSDVLMQAFNNSPDATNHLGWCFKRVNQKTGESEDFELMIRRTEGKTTTELLGGAGGTKTVNVRHAHCGGDWDKGKFLIYPTEILTKEGK